MSPGRSGSASWVSAATLTGASLVVLLDRARVEKSVSSVRGVSLGNFPEVPAGLHPVCAELWRVRGARLRLAGRSQDEIWTAMGQAAGASVGAFYGASIGFLRGLTSARSTLRAGAAAGARIGAQTGARFGNALAAPFANCHELMIGVPGVRYGGQGPFHLVLEMFSDSMVAVVGARAGGYGYNKQVTKISLVDDTWSVSASSGEKLFNCSFQTRPLDQTQYSSLGAIPVVGWLTTPLLGRSAADVSASVLERAFDADGVSVGSATGTLTAAHGLLEGTHEAVGLAPGNPCGGIGFANLPVRVSVARRLEPTDAPGS